MEKFILVLLSLTILSYQKAYSLEPISSCIGTNLNYTKGSLYEKNLKLLLSDFVSKSSSLKFYEAAVGNASNQVYGLFQCRYDTGLADCAKCVKDSTEKIVKECPKSGEAILWPDVNQSLCMVRYANRNISSLPETDPGYLRNNPNNVTDYDEFKPILLSTLKELIQNASFVTPHFASSEVNWTLFERVFSFAQCTFDIDRFECYDCLDNALSNMIDCCSHYKGSKVLLPSCQLRFESAPFLNETFLNEMNTPATTPPSAQASVHPPSAPPPSKKGAPIAGIVAGVVVGLLVLGVLLWFCLLRKKSTKASDHVPLTSHDVENGAQNIGNTEFVHYDFPTLSNASGNFSAENKLGEGGFGAVYKGTLANGEFLAIKRLSGSSGQGTKEFMAEAGLLAKLQHRNLVKLIGFCSQGDEKLLVYEFMSNSSLDSLLFDPEQREKLDWVIRSKIILGITRGLQYLHEGSRLTIIHRDLKPANILLDNEMNPKIADFGLAKLFEATQTSANTSYINGTMGYMAPEYIEMGEYSDKSDVYSFGIMLLEIINGHSNKLIYRTQQEDLPVYAWRLWNEERTYDLIDPILNNNNNNSSRNEMIRCIQIGLLCLQANAIQRPTMTKLILMLSGSVDLPVPSTPAMSFPQFKVPSSNNSRQLSDQLFTKSTTGGSEKSQNMHPKPR